MKTLISLLLASSALLSSNVVFADSAPGIACKAARASDAGLFDAVSITGLKRTTDSTGANTIVCPIQKSGTIPLTGFTVNLNHDTNKTTPCTIARSNAVTGATYVSAGSATGVGNVSLSFNDITNNNEQPDDVYALVCTVGFGTTVRSYTWGGVSPI